jgi:hypothetical protein
MFDDLLESKEIDEIQTPCLREDNDEVWDTGAVWSTGQIPNDVWTTE